MLGSFRDGYDSVLLHLLMHEIKICVSFRIKENLYGFAYEVFNHTLRFLYDRAMLLSGI